VTAVSVSSLAASVHRLPTSTGLSIVHWLAVLRIGLGLWWLESWRHKNKEAWFKRGSGISWAQSVAEKHRWGFVKKGFDTIVAPRPKVMSYVIVYSELALGLGLVLGFLTPIAAVFSMLLNLVYFTLMIHDWAEQGQNSMMFVMALVVFGAHGWQTWSLDHALHLFGH
jgi:thiosulfate dehydrogenase [quinone] large subunit